MAQLRDAVTSELLGEGTPEAMVLLAEQLGRDDVLFDGVESEHNPGTFDADAVLQAREERLSGLQDAIQAETDAGVKERLESTLKADHAVAEEAKEIAPDARDRLDTARAQVDAT